jgi:hypothetical protein
MANSIKTPVNILRNSMLMTQPQPSAALASCCNINAMARWPIPQASLLHILRRQAPQELVAPGGAEQRHAERQRCRGAAGGAEVPLPILRRQVAAVHHICRKDRDSTVNVALHPSS